MTDRGNLSQRSDYTHKFNSSTGRHGWLRLTPAYSVKIVEELLSQYGEPQRVLDPFCGTGTTALSAAYHGHVGVTTDINPFLVWLGRAKTARYTAGTIASTRDKCTRIAQLVKRDSVKPVTAPRIFNIERWWSPESLKFLCILRACIEAESEDGSPERQLLFVAFCRTLIDLSNASYNHQSMSFGDDSQLHLSLDIDMRNMFTRNVRFVLEGATENPSGTGSVVLCDSRDLSNVSTGYFDLVITSPPYVNRMSYIRELRPYMYWLGFLDSGRAAGELDWSAIGGTWGSATSRLIHWKRPVGGFKSRVLDNALQMISDERNKNGRILANYVAKYFCDMWTHFRSLVNILETGSNVHYIVGQLYVLWCIAICGGGLRRDA